MLTLLLLCLSTGASGKSADVSVSMEVVQTETNEYDRVTQLAIKEDILVAPGESFALPNDDKLAYAGELRLFREDKTLRYEGKIRLRRTGEWVIASGAIEDLAKWVVAPDKGPRLELRLQAQ